jgi:hypothetical protein
MKQTSDGTMQLMRSFIRDPIIKQCHSLGWRDRDPVPHGLCACYASKGVASHLAGKWSQIQFPAHLAVHIAEFMLEAVATIDTILTRSATRLRVAHKLETLTPAKRDRLATSGPNYNRRQLKVRILRHIFASCLLRWGQIPAAPKVRPAGAGIRSYPRRQEHKSRNLRQLRTDAQMQTRDGF